MSRVLLFTAVLSLGCMPSVSPEVVVQDTGVGEIVESPSVSVSRAVVSTVADDYSLGALATVELDGLALHDTLAPTSGDAVVRTAGTLTIVLNRMNTDTFQVFEGSWATPKLDVALPDLSNPQDAVLCGGKLWVTLHNGIDLPAYDPRTGLLVGSADLSPWAGVDGRAEAASMVVVDGQILVAIQQLKQDDGWSSDGGAIVQVDCTDGVAVDWVGIGPSPSIRKGPSASVAYKVGLYGPLDGRLGLLDHESKEDVILVEEADLGVDIYGFDVSQQHLVYTTADDDWRFQVHCLDLATGITTHSDTTSSYLSGVSMDPFGRVWVSRRLGWSSTEAEPTGLDLIDVRTCQSIFTEGGPMATALPPFNVVFQ